MPLNTSISLLGVRVDSVNWADIDTLCEQFLHQGDPKHIVTINGEFILEAQKNQPFRQIIYQADLVIPDSTNVVWMSRLKDQPLKQVTPGSDLVLHLCQLAALTKKSVFLLGGKPGVAAKAADKLQNDYPDLIIAGTSDADPDDPNITNVIKKSQANIVLVAYGSPKQEFWIDQNKHETGAQVLVGIGGTFDMLAGTLPRAPKWLRALHLEWLWRLILQPSRIGRIWRAVVVFPLKVLSAK